jgi:hypothetical protein
MSIGDSTTLMLLGAPPEPGSVLRIEGKLYGNLLLLTVVMHVKVITLLCSYDFAICRWQHIRTRQEDGDCDTMKMH